MVGLLTGAAGFLSPGVLVLLGMFGEPEREDFSLPKPCLRRFMSTANTLLNSFAYRHSQTVPGPRHPVRW